jgi:TolB-like protein/Flp pilus assembly protein TadD
MGIGIAEDILTELAQIHGLKVISRSSSLRYKNSEQDIRTIARELDVTNILEGSIRQYDQNLRVSVRLIQGQTESLIWAADFDRQIEDVLNVQKDIAMAVSENLKIALSPVLKNRFEDKAMVDPEAYVHYQKGRELLLRSSGTKADMESAIQHFESAILRDSSFSKAWVGLGEAYLESVFWHRIETQTALPKAKYAAMRVLELDPALGEGHTLLGTIAYYEKDYRESEKHLRKAMEYNPNYSQVYDRLGWIVIMRGQDEEALQLLYKTIELDPLSTRNKGSLGNAYALLGRYEEGIALMESYLEPNPTDNFLLWTLGYLQALNGQCDKAIESLNKRSIGKKTNWVLTYCYAKTGNRKAAEEILQTNLEKSKTELVPDFMLAVQFNALGYPEEAVKHLKKSINHGGETFFVISLERDPMFENLWSHPEYQNLVRQVKREFGVPERH